VKEQHPAEKKNKLPKLQRSKIIYDPLTS